MVDYNRDRPEVERNRLLYDEELLGDITDDLGNAIEVKQEVKTSAHVWEIRAAQEYWFGGQLKPHRMAERVWHNCKAVDDGMWALTPDNELVDADTVDL